MNAKQLAESYKNRFDTYAIARRNALNNIVNRKDIYRPSNKFVDDFWSELKKLYN